MRNATTEHVTTPVCLCMGVWCVSIDCWAAYDNTIWLCVCVCSLLGEHHDNTCLLCVWVYSIFRPGSEVQCECGISMRQLENFSTIFKVGT